MVHCHEYYCIEGAYTHNHPGYLQKLHTHDKNEDLVEVAHQCHRYHFAATSISPKNGHQGRLPRGATMKPMHAYMPNK
jgi:hypothetical protein